MNRELCSRPSTYANNESARPTIHTIASLTIVTTTLHICTPKNIIVSLSLLPVRIRGKVVRVCASTNANQFILIVFVEISCGWLYLLCLAFEKLRKWTRLLFEHNMYIAVRAYVCRRSHRCRIVSRQIYVYIVWRKSKTYNRIEFHHMRLRYMRMRTVRRWQQRPYRRAEVPKSRTYSHNVLNRIVTAVALWIWKEMNCNVHDTYEVRVY